MAYDDKDHYRCFETYRSSGGNMTATARKTGVSKPTLYEWRKAGLPEALTGGKDWDAFIAEKEKERIQELEVSHIEEERTFIEREKARTKRVLDTIYRSILSGDVEIKASDYDKLMRLYILLDNREQDKIDFMQGFAHKVIGIVAEVLMNADKGEQLFTLFRSKMTTLQESEKDKIGLIPRNNA